MSSPIEPSEWQVDGEEFLLNPVFEPDAIAEPIRIAKVVKNIEPAVAMRSEERRVGKECA